MSINFLSKNEPPLPKAPRLALPPQMVEPQRDFAPQQLRGLETPMRTVKSFAELLTKELDDIVAAAEAQLDELKREAQAVRDVYVAHTDGIAADIKRLQDGVALSIKTMLELRENCEKLNAQGPEVQGPPAQKELPI